MDKSKGKQIAGKPVTNNAKVEPQPAPVAVLTITFLPPSNQVAHISPQFPVQMAAQDVLHILRRAEETLIGQMAAAELQQKRDESQVKNDAAPNG